jgi:hypothetical protein
MAEKTLVQKLLIKPGMRGAVINAPAGFREQLGDLPEGAQLDTSLDGRYQFLLLFVESRATLTSWASKLLEAGQPGVLLWVAFPKKSGSIKADINRDAGWEPLQQAGWDAIASISIDDTWSALRFRPVEEIKRTGSRQNQIADQSDQTDA